MQILANMEKLPSFVEYFRCLSCLNYQSISDCVNSHEEVTFLRA